MLTTTALDYDTWESYYPVGLQKIEGVGVGGTVICCKNPKKMECSHNK